MTEVRFYHMTRSTLEAALPQMLEKTLERGQKAVVMAGSDARVEALNGHLWSYHDRSFLPHGSKKDGYPERQPVWLTIEDERPNQAEVLFLTDGATSEQLEDFQLCAVLFDGKAQEAVQAARAQWTGYKDAGHNVTYWQQDEEGRWSQKA
ncbi:DNA polymerase III subunit chi [Denitrobaculum tricleocarpae]|uniref:DNA polymerase III subunit chi n=1 Tax=Denitrobaculum tricleocarpae TaxID=2591009 RepID=A0A545TTY0_9PROT|nr:DNA polymerase III subunit chi [Denitrobaculum tricleocarpae]TQV80669.1 DNA polymerase III subunit chi [Denitrobaculum tricleocarpae]